LKAINRLKGLKAHLNETHGTDELCAWKVAEANGVTTVWIQTRNPAFLKPILKLGSDRKPKVTPRLVTYACTGGYLKVYEIDMPFAAVLTFIQSLLEREESRAA
jgi:hypothetical protein